MRWKPEKTLRLAALILLVSGALSGCMRTGSRSDEERESSPREDVAYEGILSHFEESVAVSGVNETGSPYYGVMHVRVLDVNGNPGESKTVYSFREKNDPENAWSVTGLEIGYIGADIVPGADVAVLFHGDVIRDAENIEVIAVLPDGGYQIRKTQGTTVSNTMSSFVINTASGETLSFIRDNCRIEEGAMNRDSGDIIAVYYADGGELGNYPLRVYALK